MVPGGRGVDGGRLAAVSGAAAAWLWASGAFGAYWDEVWRWGRLYAGSTFVESPLRNGILRTVNWMGFHAAAVSRRPPASAWKDRGFAGWDGWRCRWPVLRRGCGSSRGTTFCCCRPSCCWPRVAWCCSAARRVLVALLLLIPLVRFAPSYWTALRDPAGGISRWTATAAPSSDFVRASPSLATRLFVWGYRPEIYVYTGLPAGTRFLDSQPLTGVPADRHLTQSEPVETVEAALRRAELSRSRPAFVLDALGPLNPKLAIGNYAELREWMAGYRELGRAGGTVVYQDLANSR